MKIYSVNDSEFKQYGRVLTLNVEDIVKEAEKIEMPSEGSVYIPSCEEFETLPIMNTVKDGCFGTLPIRLGYCYGHSNMLNALEWHMRTTRLL